MTCSDYLNDTKKLSRRGIGHSLLLDKRLLSQNKRLLLDNKCHSYLEILPEYSELLPEYWKRRWEMISSPTNLPLSLFPLNKGIPKGRWQYGSKNTKNCICNYSREEIARNRWLAETVLLRSTFYRCPVLVRYLLAICPLLVRSLTGQIPNK